MVIPFALVDIMVMLFLAVSGTAFIFGLLGDRCYQTGVDGWICLWL